MKNSKHIGIRFNIVLLIYFCVLNILDYLFSPEDKTVVPWDKVYESWGAFALFIAVVFLIITIALGSLLVKIFWNRFVSDVFNIREITYYEAMALVIIVSSLLT